MRVRNSEARTLRRQRRVFNTSRRAAFYADMARFSDAGIPSFRALEKMADIARRRGHKHLLAIYKRIMDSTGEGGSIAKGLSAEVPGPEAVMLTAAAAGGPEVVQGVLSQMAGLLDRQVLVGNKLRKVIIANAVTLGVIAAVISMIMVIVVPQLRAGVTPEMARLMVFAPGYFAFGDWFLRIAPVLLALGLGLAGWVVWALPRWHIPRPRWRRAWFDRHVPPFTFYVRMQTTFFLASVASMMQAGIPASEVFSGMREQSTPWMRAHLGRMLRRLDGGQDPVDALNSGLLPSDTADRLSVYSIIPNVTVVMRRLADDNFSIYEARIDLLARMLSTFSIVLLVLFAGATLFAIFDFSNAIAMGSKVSSP